MKKGAKILAMLFVALVMVSTATGEIIYVDDDGSADFINIQAAINDSNDGDIIIVNPGTYTGDGNHDIDFNGKAITVRSVDPNDPEVVAATVIACGGSDSHPHRGFYFHKYEGWNSILTGFTITNGYAERGGGISLYRSRPTIRNCVIRDNFVTYSGGGIACTYSGARIDNCTIAGNSAASRGGGIWCRTTSAVVSNCIILGNSANHGGGIHFDLTGSSPTAVNCIIAQNSAADGGGIYVVGHSGGPKVQFCTITNNGASIGGGICCKSLDTTLDNCIIWANSAGVGAEIALTGPTEVGGFRSSCSVSYSDVRVGPSTIYLTDSSTLSWNPGNIDADPLFVSPVAGNYHLFPGSPSIDAGDPNYIPSFGKTDIDGEPRLMGGRVDMGSDEFTSTHTPILIVSPTEFQFSSYENGPNPKEQIMSIRNIGSSTLNWEITEDCPWLDVYPASGESTGQFNEVTLSADITGMGPDSYECLLTIDAIDALNIPQVVKVTLKLGGSELFVPSEYDTIQAAIDAAIDWDTVIVAEGTYTGTGNRDIDFHGKEITVRSENGPENCIIDCRGTEDEPHRGFYFHSREDMNSVLSGFTITNGYAGYGGGIYCVSSHPSISNCTFRDNTGQYWYGGQYGTLTPHENRSSMVDDDGEVHINIPPPLPGWRGYGGGIYCRLMSSPTLTNCKFIGNSAYEYGGGMYNYYNSNPTLINCRFSGNFVNRGIGSGGGIENRSGSSPTLRNCTFSANSALNGGAIRNSSSSPSLFNCIFNGNSVGWSGGCMHNSGSNPTLTNCTFSGNSAVLYGGVIFNSGSDATLSNCILRGNTATQGNEIYLDFYTDFLGSKIPSTINVDYSNVEGGAAGVYVDTDCTLNWGEGIIDADPYFVSPGFWDTNGVWIEGDYHLLADSPCIDAGDPNYAAGPNETDFDGMPRVIGGRIDMGAYETMPSIPAEVRIIPRTINLASKGNWITCYIRLPEGYNVAGIEPNSVFLEYEIEPEQLAVDEQKQVAIAKFSREELRGIISAGDIELTITGRLNDGTIFEATDVIRVIDEGRKKN